MHTRERIREIEKILAIEDSTDLWRARHEFARHGVTAQDIQILCAMAQSVHGFIKVFGDFEKNKTINKILIQNKPDDLVPGKCPECGEYYEMRFDVTSGEVDCVACGASWERGEAITSKGKA